MNCVPAIDLQTIFLGILFIGGGVFWCFSWHNKIDQRDKIEDAYCAKTPIDQWKPISTDWYVNRIAAMIIPLTTGAVLFFLCNKILR